MSFSQKLSKLGILLLLGILLPVFPANSTLFSPYKPDEVIPKEIEISVQKFDPNSLLLDLDDYQETLNLFKEYFEKQMERNGLQIPVSTGVPLIRSKESPKKWEEYKGKIYIIIRIDVRGNGARVKVSTGGPYQDIKWPQGFAEMMGRVTGDAICVRPPFNSENDFLFCLTRVQIEALIWGWSHPLQKS